jgi:imidazolonepropionase-like amidohydrolase
MLRFIRLVLSAVALAALAGCATTTQRADLLIQDVTIHAGTGAPPFVGTVAVRDGAFSFVGRTPHEAIVAEEAVGGRGLYLTPGLWDMHVHVRASEQRAMDVARFPMHGVTSVRDLGGFGARIDALRAVIDADPAAGPRIYATRETLNGEAFAPFQRVVANETDAVAAIDAHVAAGAVQIKIHRALKPEMLPVVLRIAHARGLAVTGHIPLGVHPLQACELGMDGIEHIGSFLEAYISVTPGATSASAIDYMLSEASTPTYRCLADKGVEVAPTLVFYPAVARARAKGKPFPREFDDFIAGTGRIAARLHRSGVTLLAGSDTSDLEATDIAPGRSLLDELQLLQDAGIPANEVVVIATTNAARTIGVDATVGTVEAGKTADFLLLTADPGEDVGNFHRLRAAYRGGRQVFPR